MCPGCGGKVWTALQILWSTLYVICGAAQLIAGIFFMISIPSLHLSCNIWCGAWNIIIGISGGVLACFGQLSPRRQEFLLYMAISILTANCVNIVIAEWGLYFSDMPKILKNHPNHTLIDYACFATRIATATVILVSFLDSQFAFCSMQTTPKIDKKKKLRGSHEQVSDIEYIIPRPKTSKPSTVYNAYAQSWVFESDNAGASCSGNNNLEAPYLKVLENGTTPTKTRKNHQNILVMNDTATTQLIDTPSAAVAVHIEEASSDDSNSNSDRKLCHMKSFSRSTSPVILSASSSHISLNQPPIYECLEKLTEPTIYRSRLNTALSNRLDDEEDEDDEPHYQAPQAIMIRRVESSVSPHAEKVQYASLMKELQRAIVSKKELTSPLSTSESATEKTQSDSKSSSRHDSSRSDATKNSDAEFSKELEAALQLIQDLESPNTIETPSDTKLSIDNINQRPIWRNSNNHSDGESDEKTLSAVGSLAEITSPLNECQATSNELYTTTTTTTTATTFKPPSTNGKSASVIVTYPDSQSTSGYSSPTTSHPSNGNSPNCWSTTSSINGSNNDVANKPMSYSIHNNSKSTTTVISLYSNNNSHQSKGKSITLVNISGDIDRILSNNEDRITTNKSIINSNNINKKSLITTQTDFNNKTKTGTVTAATGLLQPTPIAWNVKSLLRKRKQSLPKLCPELEGAIIKSESLAYLSELELLARHQRNKEIQREIEERVIQQLGTPRTESNC